MKQKIVDILDRKVLAAQHAGVSDESLESAIKLQTVLTAASDTLNDEKCSGLCVAFTAWVSELKWELESKQLAEAITAYMTGGNFDDFVQIWNAVSQVKDSVTRSLQDVVSFMIDSAVGAVNTDKAVEPKLLPVCDEISQACHRRPLAWNAYKIIELSQGTVGRQVALTIA